MDELKDKAREALTEHRDKIEEGMDKAAAKAKEKAGDEHSGKVDSLLDKGRDALDKFTGGDEGPSGKHAMPPEEPRP
ncbi:MAG TPA: antitoxin [Acidimicrobiia bacterium]|nr:antitoxin [Acidimicrobiia bacterium]